MLNRIAAGKVKWFNNRFRATAFADVVGRLTPTVAVIVIGLISIGPTTPSAPGANVGNAVANPANGRVWLSDLAEKNVRVAAGKFGKHGLASFTPGPIRIGGISSHHGLGMFADAHVEYALGKKYHTFRASVVLDDSAGTQIGRPLEFRVVGDGRELWKSHPFDRRGNGQPCLLDVSGVDVLRLEVRFLPNTNGNELSAHAAWIEPYVSEEPVPAKALPWYSPDKFAAQYAYDVAISKIRPLLDAEKFAELETLAKQWRAKDEYSGGVSMLFSFYLVLSQPHDASEDAWKKHFELLERWRQAQPGSITPLVVLGNAYTFYAWLPRGQGFASAVPKDAWPKFEERLHKAHEYLEKAEAIGGDPEVYRALVDVARAEGAEVKSVLALVEKGRKLAPRYYSLYESAAIYFLPQWSGDKAGVQKFAALMRDELGGELGADVYFRIATQQVPHLSALFFGESGFTYQDLLPGIKVVLRDFPENGLLYSTAAYLACVADDDDTARLLIARIDPATITPYPWGGYSRMIFWRARANHDRVSDEAGTFFPGPPLGNIAFVGSSNRLITSGEGPELAIVDPAIPGFKQSIPVKPGIGGMSADGQGQNVVVRWNPHPPLPSHEACVYKIGSQESPLILKGHTADVTRVGISRDGKRCVTAASDNTARIWNLADPEKPLTLNHVHGAFNVAIAADGKLVATSDERGLIFLWDGETGKPAAEPLGAEDEDHGQCRLRFLPDGKQLIWATLDGTIRRWNYAEREFQETHLEGDFVSQIEVSPDGKLLAISHPGGAVDLMAVDSLKVIHTWYAHFMAATGLAFSADGKLFASGSIDGGLKVWPLDKVLAP